MPNGTSACRIEAIEKSGAKLMVTKLNYDATVKLVAKNAKKNKWDLVQDTAWRGYTKIPGWIAQGYSTMLDEVMDDIRNKKYKKPSHVFLQVGVGSMAGAVISYFLKSFGKNAPCFIVMEPSNAACLYKSIEKNDGKAHTVEGSLKTIMAGLACGKISTTMWKVLQTYPLAYFSCPDFVAKLGMVLARKATGGDSKIVSGESGALGLGLIYLLMKEKSLAQIRNDLKLNKKSRVLLFNTEGSTNPYSYRKILRSFLI